MATNGAVGGICQHCKEGLVCGGEEGAPECCGVFKHRICFSAAQIRNARGHDTISYATCFACVKNNQQVIGGPTRAGPG
ncbi:hypothetical protein HYALB_00003902 [Hymenoscyphus albidus]|uniref:Uncharacterized protein n=1 Tax=Hymenoscyphus albidus TaxID=595503 RepID=A0A9N9LY90_9HELO|nr:hypothetical protein HYALB_00003902 [Hymenoscyphus albidus]